MRRGALILIGLCLVASAPQAARAAPGSAATYDVAAYPYTLLELDRARGRLAVPILRRDGGYLVSRTLEVWRVRNDVALRLLPGLERAGELRAVEPDRPIPPLAAAESVPDPLVSGEWWLAAVGADRAVPPGPGKPVTVVDSGLDLSHPEFAGRPNTFALNAQHFSSAPEEEHGTAVSSVIAAPANGVGLVGVYPQAVLQVWDASPSGSLTDGDEIAGIDAAARKGAGVINLSLGGRGIDPLELDAVRTAFRDGSLVVAAAGNDRESGSPLAYPANLPHVLTVAATDEQDAVTGFSSASPAVDLAAPGQDIPVAIPTIFNPSGFAVLSGTSFSAPIVSGAAAWVWTARPELDNTQLFEVMRTSAKDIGQPGFDRDTGFGLLDIPAALALAAPAPDPQEPNEDVDLIKPNGLFAAATPPVTAPRRLQGSLQGRLDRIEDPHDVYRAWLPARRRLVVTLTPTADVQLAVWGPRTRSVNEGGAASKRDLLGLGTRPGTATETVTVRNASRLGHWLYVDAYPARSTRAAAYTLSVATRAL